MSKCAVCKKEVDWETVVEVFGETLGQVDSYGEESLTEHEQMVYHQEVCSEKCFYELD